MEWPLLTPGGRQATDSSDLHLTPQRRPSWLETPWGGRYHGGNLFLDHPFPVRLTGTKYACGRGGCGACTVMVSKHDPVSRKIRYPAQRPEEALLLCQPCILTSQPKISKDLPVLQFSLSIDLRPL